MSINTIFTMADKLSIDRRRVTGVQYSRSQVVKTSESPTKNPWRFSLTVGGRPWNSMREVIEQLTHLDRVTPEVIDLSNNYNFTWLFEYRGELTASQISALRVVSFIGNQLTLTGFGDIQSNTLVFKSGDLIQLGSSYHPFTVITDTYRGGSTNITVTTHRPNVLSENVTGGGLVVGADCKIQMFMANFPTYYLTPGALSTNIGGGITNNGIVQWDGEFQLVEYF